MFQSYVSATSVVGSRELLLGSRHLRLAPDAGVGQSVLERALRAQPGKLVRSSSARVLFALFAFRTHTRLREPLSGPWS